MGLVVHNSRSHIESLKGRAYEGRVFNSGNIFGATLADAQIGKTVKIKDETGGIYRNSITRQRFLDEKIYPRLQKARDAYTNLKSNAATGYDKGTLVDFVGWTIIDINRLVADYSDFRDRLYNISIMPEASQEIKLRLLLPPTGKGKDFSGTGDMPPLMEHRLGLMDDIRLAPFGFGDVTQLNEILWSPNYNLIAEGAARIIADEKNALVFKPMVKATYDALHSVPFAKTTGLSKDELMYETLRNALDMSYTLINPLTNRFVYKSDFESVLFIEKSGEAHVRGVIEGNLRNVGGARIIGNPLPIDNIVIYSGGENDGETYQGETLSYPGVPKGVAYLVLKERAGAQLVEKIDWTLEVDPASSRINGETRYYYTVFGVYNENVLPATVNGKAYGAIIKIALE
jgi:hypothetical protein